MSEDDDESWQKSHLKSAKSAMSLGGVGGGDIGRKRINSLNVGRKRSSLGMASLGPIVSKISAMERQKESESSNMKFVGTKRVFYSKDHDTRSAAHRRSVVQKLSGSTARLFAQNGEVVEKEKQGAAGRVSGDVVAEEARASILNEKADDLEWLNKRSNWENYYDNQDKGKLEGSESATLKEQGKSHSKIRVSQFLGKNARVAPAPTLTYRSKGELSFGEKVQDNIARGFVELRSILFVQVLMPHHTFIKIWEPWIVVCVLWNAVLLPYNLAFDSTVTQQEMVFVDNLDKAIDWMFILDLFLNFAKAYVDDWGALVTDRREIAQTYLSKWFWVDLPATLPFELFVPSSQATLINMVKCIRLIRITKILKFLERFRFANSARIMRLFASLMLVCHWIGCIWFFLGYNASAKCSDWPEYFDIERDDILLNGTWVNMQTADFVIQPSMDPPLCSWLSVHNLATARTTSTQYLKSVYWAVTTITSVGYGDIVPVTDGETLFTILNMLMGAGIYAMIFSNFVSYIARMDQAATKYSEKMEDIRGQMRYLRLPQHIVERVEQYFEYVWLCHKGLLDRDNYFFDELPLPLHIECAEHLHMATVQKNPLFRGCSQSFLRGVLVRLKPQIVVPFEYVVNKGDVSTAMFFIARGELEVLTDKDGETLSILREGDYFGDIGVLTRRKRTASIRAISFCDLHFLIADELRELLLMYEKDSEILSKNALEFVKRFEEKADMIEEMNENLRARPTLDVISESPTMAFQKQSVVRTSSQTSEEILVRKKLAQ